MRAAWISYSSIQVSETFLAANVSALRSMGDVLAMSGAAPSVADPDRGRGAGLRLVGFSSRGESRIERIRRAIDARHHHWERIQRDCLRSCLPELRAFRPDFIWFDYGTSAVMAERLIEAVGSPFVIAVHGYDVSSGFKDRFYEQGFARVVRNASAVVCASHHMRRLAVLGGADPDASHVVRYAVDSDAIRRDTTIEKTAWPSFVHFGRLTWQKNPFATLQAFSIVRQAIPDARLTFIGDGHLRADLEARCRSLGLASSVRFAGAMPHAEALPLVQSHWVFVQHSATGIDGSQEGFALSPAEAALMLMPVVSTFHDGIPEHVLDGVTGLLVPEYDYEAMAQKMIVLAQSSELRDRMGAAGRENIRSMCAPEARIARIAQILKPVVR
jgi:colanic acid/amylovoran biosynthesis glycosyltransferase